MEYFFNFLITAVVFTGIYWILQLFVHRKERLLMIDKGTSLPETKPYRFSVSSLRFGLLFIGIGVGALIGNILEATTVINDEVAYFSMIFLFGGLALVIHHRMDRKNV